MTDTEARDDPNQEENEDAQHSDSSCESDSEEELGRFTERIALMDSFRPFFGCLRSGSDAPDLNHVVSGILSGKFQEIVVLTGAGISVSAGIPDFRSPGTGLYANLQKYNLPEPEAIFALDFFSHEPVSILSPRERAVSGPVCTNSDTPLLDTLAPEGCSQKGLHSKHRYSRNRGPAPPGKVRSLPRQLSHGNLHPLRAHLLPGVDGVQGLRE